jgi:hypothetical protein
MNFPPVSRVLTTILALTSVSARAEQKCSDLLLHFVDESDLSKADGKHSEQRKVTALIPCESSSFSKPYAQPTTLHFMEHSGNSLCVSQRTCGNITAWWGYFATSVGWSDLTLLRDFWILSRNARINTDWNGYQVVGTFAIAGGQIERDCSPMTPATCVDTSTGVKNDDLSWK